MKKYKFLAAVCAASMLLAGCVSQDQVDLLQQQVNEMSAKELALESKIAALEELTSDMRVQAEQEAQTAALELTEVELTEENWLDYIDFYVEEMKDEFTGEPLGCYRLHCASKVYPQGLVLVKTSDDLEIDLEIPGFGYYNQKERAYCARSYETTHEQQLCEEFCMCAAIYQEYETAQQALDQVGACKARVKGTLYFANMDDIQEYEITDGRRILNGDSLEIDDISGEHPF